MTEILDAAPIQLVAFYTAITILILIYCSIRVITYRRRNKIGLGFGADTELSKRVRIHGNFTEYVPMALLGLFALAFFYPPTFLLHGLGITLILGRLLHLWGLGKSSGSSFGRVAGMMLTFFVLLVEAIALLYFTFTY